MLTSMTVDVKKDKYTHPFVNIPYIYHWAKIYNIMDFHPAHHRDIYRPLINSDMYVCLNIEYLEIDIDHGPYCEKFKEITVENNIPFSIILSNIL